MKLLDTLETLALIERIAADDFCSDVECRLLNGKYEGDAKEMAEKLRQIYCIAHSLNPTHSCYGSHEGWRKGAEGLYKKLMSEE